jgi:20S proteasome subunit beta 2
MGSGSLNAMAVFESEFKDDMTREEAIALVAKWVAVFWGFQWEGTW